MSIIKCQCGAIELKINDNAASTRLRCGCDSCNGFSKYLGESDRLDEYGAVELFQTTPDQVQIAKGKDKLKAYLISEKGVQRWYCGKCRTHMANTMRQPKLAFIGLPLPREMNAPAMPELGDLKGYVQTKKPDGMASPPKASFFMAGVRIMLRALRANKQSDWQEGKSWIIAPELMESAERERLYQLAKS